MLKLPVTRLSLIRRARTVVALLPVLSGAALIGAAPVQAQDTWASAPDMLHGRYSPATVRLPDGRVLVASGHTGSDETTSAQIFNPTTNAWMTAGDLKRGRNFSVTMLVDGDQDGTDETALIFGGWSDYDDNRNTVDGSLKTVERYDAAANTFSYLTYDETTTKKVKGQWVPSTTAVQSDMVHARELFTGTKLPDGKVLLVGGFKTFTWSSPNGTLNSAEIYDPVTRKFAATGSMSSTGTPYGRFGHDAILLPYEAAYPKGRVLIVGGKERRSNSDWRSLRSIEIYDVATGTFTHVADMAHRRDRVTLAWVGAEKKVLIVGGKTEAAAVGEATADVLPCEWFDPATNTVSPGPSLAQGRMGHTLTPLGNDEFLVVGGWSEKRADGTRGTTNVAERYAFIPDGLGGGTYGFVSAGSTLYDTHDQGAAALDDGRVLIVGGKQVTNGSTAAYPKRTELYTP